ncbi:MAG: hypothetical protein EBW11_04160 [Betaproteobacteria bacterium]|nr:hypothetical protein [Betaproteobacteria bacterium]
MISKNGWQIGFGLIGIKNKLRKVNLFGGRNFMKRRKLLKHGGLAGILAAASAPAMYMLTIWDE